jgi:hypothetical protein
MFRLDERDLPFALGSSIEAIADDAAARLQLHSIDHLHGREPRFTHADPSNVAALWEGREEIAECRHR